jgi:deazaflavin-dependent oxidoreductase (nitroreductase family)
MAQANWTKEHVRRYRETGGADGHIWKGHDGTANLPCLLLTTIGRKTGDARTTPLIYGRDGVDHVVIASRGGRPNHPAWYLNLDNNPRVEVQVEADVFAATARTAGVDDRDRLWKMMAEIYPPYDDYQDRAAATREIPVVVLSRT